MRNSEPSSNRRTLSARRALLALPSLLAVGVLGWWLQNEPSVIELGPQPSSEAREPSAPLDTRAIVTGVPDSDPIEGSNVDVAPASARVALDERSTSSPQRSDLASVRIRVLGLEAGQRARVRVRPTSEAERAEAGSTHDTDEQGQLVLELPPGGLHVDAWAKERRALPVEALVASGANDIELHLLRIVALRGRVTRAGDAQPIEGAHVSLHDLVDRTTSDAGGLFELSLPIDGQKHVLRCETEGFGFECWIVSQHSDGSWQSGFEQQHSLRSNSRFREALPELELQLVPARTIRGEVHGPDGPLAGASVAASGSLKIDQQRAATDKASAKTDAAGRFELLGLRPDVSHVLTITHDEHPQRRRHRRLTRRQLLVPASVEPVQEVGLVRLARGCKLTIHLRDRMGAPIEQALIVLEAEVPTFAGGEPASPMAFPRDHAPRPMLRHTVRTGADGSAELEQVAAGSYEIEARDLRAELVPERFDVRESAEQRLELELSSSARITGRVLSAEGALAGVRIELRYSGGRHALSSADGSFSFAGLVEGRGYELRAAGWDSNRLIWLPQTRKARPGDSVELVLVRKP